MKKLIPALCMLLVSALLMGTSTYAWFSMNNKVTVTGMSINTKIQDNLMIADDTLASTAVKAENLFKNGLNQTVTGTLEPASTVDGEAFWYTLTSNVQADGDAITDAYKQYDDSTAAKKDEFDENYGFTTDDTQEVFPYKDYVFQLKAINSDASTDKNVKLTSVNLLYNGAAAAANEIKAFRVAVFVEDLGTGSTDPAGGVGTLLTVLRQSGAQYFSNPNNYAINANAAPNTAVTKLDTAATIGAVAHGTTKYFKVVVRMWLEGEDKTCNNSTYLSLTEDWTLDLVMELGTGAGATNISTTARAIATAATNKATVTLSDTTTGTIENGETAVSFQWIDADTGAAPTTGSGADTYQFTNASSAKNVYCEITTTRGSVYRTNVVPVTAS